MTESDRKPCPSVDRTNNGEEFHCVLPENHEGRCTTGRKRGQGRLPHTWMRLSELLRTSYHAEYVPTAEGGPALRMLPNETRKDDE